jgi:hypothetical protein
MKKCQKCGFENTDIMNFCLECGESLPSGPQMVVPLETVQFSGGTENPSERVTEDYDPETVVNNRLVVPTEPTDYSTFVDQPTDAGGGSYTKIFLAVGGGLVALVLLVGVAAAGLFVYALQKQGETPPNRPVVAKTPVTDDTEDVSTPFPDDAKTPDIAVAETPETVATPEAENTPQTDSDTITFPTPTSPTKRATYRVKTISGWQLSEIQTVPLENFRITVKGKVDLDGIKNNVTAKGVEGHKDRRIVKEYPTGALLMRTHYPDGRHSNIQPVSAGEYWQNFKDETGRIEFLINDNAPENNDGEFTISFTMQDVPKK